MVSNVKMLGKASALHSLMLLNASMLLFSAVFSRESFPYHTFSSGTNSFGDFVKSLR